jgi:hypothetical protein
MFVFLLWRKLIVHTGKEYYSNGYQITCFMITGKSYNVATRRAGLRGMKTAQNSQRSNGGTGDLKTLVGGGGGGGGLLKFCRGHEA